MLTDLIIRNFAIIDRLQVTFGPGFNVLTGETGAGKSIVIDAVGLLLGERARPELIRTGTEEATVEALFDLAARPEIRRQLAEAGFDNGDELLVRRIVSRSGKNKVFINGALATLGQLQELTAGLMVIHGQHAQQGLQRPDLHLDMLDKLADSEPLLTEYRGVYDAVRELREHLSRLDEAQRERRQRLDLLGYQSRELAEANLRVGEDEELEAERLLLLHGEKLLAATSGGYETLYGEDGAVCERLQMLADALEQLTGIDPALGPLAETLRSSSFTLEDVALQLRDHGQKILFEPTRQSEVEERLALLAGLKRKYAPTIAEMLTLRERVEAELAELTDIDGTREGLERKLEQGRAQLAHVGAALSARRRQGAQTLQRRVEAELAGLAMGRARFEMRLMPLSEPGSRGLEKGEFFLAPNPGEEAKPLARIASGGELSRIMLALKSAAPEADAIATQVFDEVDAGIGGEAATAVGEKLRAVARGRQVLCITHLPQVAAFAEAHYRVEKQEREGRTHTVLTRLDEDERICEMARMLSGAKMTDRTLDHARELIGASRGA
ncbi:DNA repair protein RecN [Trichloromonas sp.]|uniref:DNA repair protein RecN n=1 Tax=Trichloromonas sp. TaxID=3069249 RepID=UPI002A3DCE98|nr:DNA repair protein RecN [Trichloromonas sp.]